MQQKPFLYPMEEKKHFSQVTISEDASEFTQSAKEAYESVLKYAGASLKYDDVDKRIIANVRNGDYTADGSNGSEKGLIDKASDVGGWPEYKKETGPKDTDGDGIGNVPDYYSTLHDRKKVEDSRSLSALLKRPNRFAFILLGLILTVILLVVCLVLLLRKLVRKLRRRKKAR